MKSDRREFLKKGAAGLAAASAGATLGIGQAHAADAPPADYEHEMPRNMTLLNLSMGQSYGLGVKLDRGILDVSAAAEMYNLPAPTDMDDLLQNGKGGLLANVVAAAADGPASLISQRRRSYACASGHASRKNHHDGIQLRPSCQ